MNFAKKLLMIVLLVAMMTPVIGCGVGTNVAENTRTLDRIAYYDSRMLVDDVSLLMLTHRTLRTSRWVID